MTMDFVHERVSHLAGIYYLTSAVRTPAATSKRPLVEIRRNESDNVRQNKTDDHNHIKNYPRH